MVNFEHEGSSDLFLPLIFQYAITVVLCLSFILDQNLECCFFDSDYILLDSALVVVNSSFNSPFHYKEISN